MIFIYQDYVHNNGALFKAMSHHFGNEQVASCDANDIKNGILSLETKAFIMPGGASRYVSAKLDGTGNQAIKDYVANGGLYIGICAGAYYACQRTEWHPDTGPAFSVENQLAFFPGVAKGPIGQFAAADVVPLVTSTGETRHAFYWQGPAFESNQQNFSTLARYTDPDIPAVVSGIFGKGCYLLFSPHLEIDNEQLDLMRFDVVDNRYADIAMMQVAPALATDYFVSVLKQHIK